MKLYHSQQQQQQQPLVLLAALLVVSHVTLAFVPHAPSFVSRHVGLEIEVVEEDSSTTALSMAPSNGTHPANSSVAVLEEDEDFSANVTEEDDDVEKDTRTDLNHQSFAMDLEEQLKDLATLEAKDDDRAAKMSTATVEKEEDGLQSFKNSIQEPADDDDDDYNLLDCISDGEDSLSVEEASSRAVQAALDAAKASNAVLAAAKASSTILQEADSKVVPVSSSVSAMDLVREAKELAEQEKKLEQELAEAKSDYAKELTAARSKTRNMNDATSAKTGNEKEEPEKEPTSASNINKETAKEKEQTMVSFDNVFKELDAKDDERKLPVQEGAPTPASTSTGKKRKVTPSKKTVPVRKTVSLKKATVVTAKSTPVAETNASDKVRKTIPLKQATAVSAQSAPVTETFASGRVRQTVPLKKTAKSARVAETKAADTFRSPKSPPPTIAKKPVSQASGPKMEMPTIDIPKMEMPALPHIDMPAMPKMEMPHIDMPTMPKMEMPHIDMPTMPKMEMPKMELDEEQVEKAVSAAKQGLSALFRGLAVVAKESIDSAIDAKNHMNTTTVGKDTDMTYEMAFEKVAKGGQGLAKLCGMFGGIVKDTVSFVAEELKSKDQQNQAVKKPPQAANSKKLSTNQVQPAKRTVSQKPAVEFSSKKSPLLAKEKMPQTATPMPIKAKKAQAASATQLHGSLDHQLGEFKSKASSAWDDLGNTASAFMKEAASTASQHADAGEKQMDDIKEKSKEMFGGFFEEVAAAGKPKSEPKPVVTKKNTVVTKNAPVPTKKTPVSTMKVTPQKNPALTKNPTTQKKPVSIKKATTIPIPFYATLKKN